MKALFSGAAAAALMLGVCSTAAEAQTYNRLVVFGDSLSDNGNLYLASGNATPASPPYWQGRFSNGRVFAEMLGFNTSNFMGSTSGSINMAFGGARTDSQMMPPGMQIQLAQYRQMGGTFGAGDLVTVLGGANNLFQGIQAAGASANPTATFGVTARSAATDVNGIVNQIAGLGAGTILVINLPQLSVTPQFAGTPGAALADYGATTFNSTLQGLLATTAAANGNTNIIQMDIYSAGKTVSADPGAFGLSNVTQACFTGTTVCSNPDQYFYFDGVHPTTKGHSILALLAMDYLYYGKLGSQVAVLGETAWRHREDDLETATNALSVRSGWDEGTRLTLSALADTVSVDSRDAIGETKSDGYGVRLALESASPNWRVGLAGSYRRSEVDAVTLKGDVDSFALDAYGGWRNEAMFVNLAVGGAQNNYRDINRLTTLAPIVHASSTDGTSLGARLQGGLWMGEGAWSLSPRGAVSWIATDVDGFNELGASADYAYQDRRLEAMTGELSLRAEYGAERFRFYAEGGWRESISDDSEAARTGLVGNTAKVLAEQVDLPYGSQALLNVGLEGRIGERLNVQIGYRGRFGDEFDSHLGGVRFSLPL